VLSDGFTGQMMEAVEFPEPVTELPAKDWAAATGITGSWCWRPTARRRCAT
jgi:hypothetical protein